MPPPAVRLLAHIAATRHLWLDRLLARSPHWPVWPDLTLAECGPLLASSEARWDDHLQALGPDDLARPGPDRGAGPRRGTGAGLHGLHSRRPLAILSRRGGAP